MQIIGRIGLPAKALRIAGIARGGFEIDDGIEGATGPDSTD